MRSIIIVCAAALGLVGVAVPAGLAAVERQPERGMEGRSQPSIVVTGRGEASGRPDRAVVRLGATAQAEAASAAQQQVNQVVGRAIEQIKALGIPEERIQTSGISLHPVYSQRPRPRGDGDEMRITGYQASNTVRVQIDELLKVGDVIDAGVSAGANEVQGVSFELRDDARQQAAALMQAARQAHGKAAALAMAMDVQLGPVMEVIESGVQPVYQMMDMRMAMGGAAEGTPVQPGEVQVGASVTVRFMILRRGDRRSGDAAEERPPAPAPDRRPGGGR